MSEMQPEQEQTTEDDPTQPPADPNATTAPTGTDQAPGGEVPEGDANHTSPDRTGASIDSSQGPEEPPD